ncbi:stage II sporulation protein M [Marinifilum caeruleilacunae]|uniref:Stage II sporulation protein M n=1 Tax=Marinifilum caeruleilacunae TaxID=2499076 RepID=A0ABX1WT45_9BACT|nr:stage II sporulation protein M [Marinifilum caeruleilacunae]NOU59167.1 stage II sporulation protein M [Marinifilum caeruleilacunae]
MKEIVFLNRNKDKWEKFEHLINHPSASNPDTLANLYIQLTDDLSYSRTFYPNSATTAYLNQLSMRVHQQIYKNRKVKKGAFKKFWTLDLPLTLFEARKQLLYAFLIFFVSVLIGVISSRGDQAFVRTILGDDYVNMTLDNIKKNDPMAVYKQHGQTSMFLGITVNNVRVSILAFVFGIFTAFGTGYILFSNGVMLGSFTYFFVRHDLFWESTRVIWIHGALEISVIIIAGAAGMVLGNSLIFTGSLPRKTSIQIGVRKGVKIIAGIFPIFVVAGFLEGYVTRHTDMPMVLSWTIILSSFAFIIWYFVLHPIKVYKNQNK